MIYKDEEILARVHYTGQKLVYLNDDGSLNLSTETIFEMEHDDDTVVWYEVSGSEHISTPFDDPKTGFFANIDDAKASIDWYEEKCREDV